MHRSTDGTRRKSRLPVLEILVIVLLLAGAGAAVWILRSSLPSKTTAATSSVVVTIAPESAHVVVGKAFDFSATVSGTDDTQVRWKVEEGDAGGRVVNRGAKAAGGTVSSLAVYIAPRTPGTYHLLATSKADPRESASAEVTVTKR
jgi:chitinase